MMLTFKTASGRDTAVNPARVAFVLRATRHASRNAMCPCFEQAEIA
jgi:hypothetical protein